MKRILSIILALSMIFSLSACKKTEKKKEKKVDEMVLRASALKVNNLTTPLGIDTTPLFSWTPKSKTIGRLQTAYQIVVSSTKKLAEDHTGDIWDTGKVESADGDCYLRLINSVDKQFQAVCCNDFCSYGKRKDDKND